MNRSGFGSICVILLLVVAGAIGLVAPPSTARAMKQKASPIWERVAAEEPLFKARDEAKGLVLGGGMWLRGGTPGGTDLVYDLWHSANGKNWKYFGKSEDFHSYSSLVSVDAKSLLAIGAGSVYRFQEPNWVKLADNQPFHLPQAAVVLNKTIICLDIDPVRVQDGKQKARLWASEDGGKTWKRINENAPFGPRRPTAMVVFKGKIWVIGGVEDEDRPPRATEWYPWKMHNDVWYSADGGLSWKKSNVEQRWQPRNWAGFACDEERIWIVGGFDNFLQDRVSDLNDVWFTTDGEIWVSQGRGTFTPRHAPTCYIHGGYLWVVAGKEKTSPTTGSHTNEVWRLPLSSKK